MFSCKECRFYFNQVIRFQYTQNDRLSDDTDTIALNNRRRYFTGKEMKVLIPRDCHVNDGVAAPASVTHPGNFVHAHLLHPHDLLDIAILESSGMTGHINNAEYTTHMNMTRKH